MLGFPPSDSIQWRSALILIFRREVFYVRSNVRDADYGGDVAAYSREQAA